MPETFTVRGRRAPEGALRTNVQQTAYGPSRFDLDSIDAAPAAAAPLSAFRFGDLSTAPVDDLVLLGRDEFGPTSTKLINQRRRGLRKILSRLAAAPGDNWSERWQTSGLDAMSERINTVGSSKDEGYELSAGFQALTALRVIRPSLNTLNLNTTSDFATHFAAASGDTELVSFFAAVDATDARPRFRSDAKYDVARAMITQGIPFRSLTWQAFLHFSLEQRGLGQASGKAYLARGKFAGLLAWDVMSTTGHFPPGTPPSLRKALYTGQLTAEQLIDRYNLRNAGVRQLLIDYLVARQVNTDYDTRDNLASMLGGRFWANIEKIAPGQSDLNLPDHVYEQWRELVRFRDDGKPRANLHSVLLPVRALYMDVQSWALEEPERWAQWSAPCPIRRADLSNFSAQRRRIKERMDDRTRRLQPLLPLLIDSVEQRRVLYAEMIEAARRVPLGAEFEFQEHTYQRTRTRADVVNHQQGLATVRVTDLANGEVTDLLAAEESAFWDWAYVEVLRHTGIRVEELIELSHTSVRQYERPNGEVIALLVIAPSKSDRERVIPMSAELFHVIASIIRRLTAGGRRIESLPRYDAAEKVWTDPLPFLFQRQHGSGRRVVSSGTVNNALQAASQRIIESLPESERIVFTPHDFRRLFATEVVNNGLPIHIGAALLGHLNINTTRGYTAVFGEDVVNHYQHFLDRRRQSRPTDEYRQATAEEWSEFEEHFDKRKVELGSCGRPYGTPCAHEHSCIRCPMLHVNPAMAARLDEIEEDLLERRARAEAEGWQGEIEGINLTLRFLAGKRANVRRMEQTTQQISLGMPGLRPSPS